MSLALCACASDTGDPADAAPTQLQLDIVVTDDAVTVYRSRSDVEQPCESSDVFPALGEDVFLSDIITCRDSCLTSATVRVGTSTVDAVIGASGPIVLPVRVGPVSDGQLRLVGCGGSTTIELRAGAAPRPTLSVTDDPVTRALTATWSASPPAASARIEVSHAFSSEVTQVTESPYTYVERHPLGFYRAVRLTTLAPPVVVETVFGPARVWAAGTTYAVVLTDPDQPWQRSTSAPTMSTRR